MRRESRPGCCEDVNIQFRVEDPGDDMTAASAGSVSSPSNASKDTALLLELLEDSLSCTPIETADVTSAAVAGGW